MTTLLGFELFPLGVLSIGICFTLWALSGLITLVCLWITDKDIRLLNIFGVHVVKIFNISKEMYKIDEVYYCFPVAGCCILAFLVPFVIWFVVNYVTVVLILATLIVITFVARFAYRTNKRFRSHELNKKLHNPKL
jgi:hypothetical protein